MSSKEVNRNELSWVRQTILWADMDLAITRVMALSEVAGEKHDWVNGLSAVKKLELFQLVVENDVRLRKTALEKHADSIAGLTQDNPADELMDILGLPREAKIDFFSVLEQEIPEGVHSEIFEFQLKTHPVFSKAMEISQEAVEVAKYYLLLEYIAHTLEILKPTTSEQLKKPPKSLY